jgi:hypothetical protein
MKTATHARPRMKMIVRLLVVPALLIAGYAGMQLGSFVHATAASALPYSQLADTCPTGSGHC